MAALVILMFAGMVMAARAAPERRALLLAAHISFFLLNMATMPMWQIEGLILYALLWGFTMDGVRLRRTLVGGEPVRAHLRPAAGSRARPV